MFQPNVRHPAVGGDAEVVEHAAEPAGALGPVAVGRALAARGRGRDDLFVGEEPLGPVEEVRERERVVLHQALHDDPLDASAMWPDRSLRHVSALAALDLPAGPAFVDWLRTVWDRGDAAFPLDPRLPAPIRAATLATMRPATVIGPDGERPWTDGEPEPVADGDGLVVATSGSTGTPKGVVLTHAAIAAHARAVHERLSVDPARDRWLACLPLAHMGGLGVVLRAVVDGVGLDVVDGPDPATVAAAPSELGSHPRPRSCRRRSTGPMRPPTGGSCSAVRPTRPATGQRRADLRAHRVRGWRRLPPRRPAPRHRGAGARR